MSGTPTRVLIGGLPRRRAASVAAVLALASCQSHQQEKPAPHIVYMDTVHDGTYNVPLHKTYYYTVAVPTFSQPVHDVHGRLRTDGPGVRVDGDTYVWRLLPDPSGITVVRALTPIRPPYGYPIPSDEELGPKDEDQRLVVPIVVTSPGCHNAGLDIDFSYDGGRGSAHTTYTFTISTLRPPGELKHC